MARLAAALAACSASCNIRCSTHPMLIIVQTSRLCCRLLNREGCKQLVQLQHCKICHTQQAARPGHQATTAYLDRCDRITYGIDVGSYQLCLRLGCLHGMCRRVRLQAVCGLLVDSLRQCYKLPNRAGMLDAAGASRSHQAMRSLSFASTPGTLGLQHIPCRPCQLSGIAYCIHAIAVAMA
jgi:hypothetical protein